MSTVMSPVVEQRVVLNVSWETYERLLADHPDAAGPRFTYDEGTLEIMVLSAPHEEPNRTLSLLVELVAAELGIDVRRLGSTTFKRVELLKGFEPDSAFYIAHASAVRGRDVEPAGDPPPDLIIEIDISRSSLARFPIFAAFGVPEVWRYDGSRVSIWRLEGGQYIEAQSSAALPPLMGSLTTQFLEESRTMRSTEWLRRVRVCARSQR
jgi:Uma2 family endonuclease